MWYHHQHSTKNPRQDELGWLLCVMAHRLTLPTTQQINRISVANKTIYYLNGDFGLFGSWSHHRVAGAWLKSNIYGFRCRVRCGANVWTANVKYTMDLCDVRAHQTHSILNRWSAARISHHSTAVESDKSDVDWKFVFLLLFFFSVKKRYRAGHWWICETAREDAVWIIDGRDLRWSICARCQHTTNPQYMQQFTHFDPDGINLSTCLSSIRCFFFGFGSAVRWQIPNSTAHTHSSIDSPIFFSLLGTRRTFGQNK